jgi:hypothetical protein
MRHSEGALDDPAVCRDRRYPKRPLTPIRLGNPHPPHRLRPVGLRPKIDDQRRQVRLQLYAKGLHGDTIHPGLPTIAAHCRIRGPQPPQVQHLPHETVKLPPLPSWRARRRFAPLPFPIRDRRLSHRNLPRLQISTQRRRPLRLPLLWTPFASDEPASARPPVPRCSHVGRAALTARHRYYEVPDFSLRIGQTFRRRLIAQPIPPALRPHRGMNTISGNATRSPQVKRSSVPPCRPHTPCLGARSAGISFALRLQARISALVADRFAWLSPWLRPGGSTQALRIPSRDGHPALLASRDAKPPGYARPLVYASPLRGCGGTFTRKRSALLGAQP